MLAPLIDQFLAEQRFAARLSSATIRGYRQSISTFALLLPGLTPSQVTPDALAEFFRRIETRQRLVGRGHERIGVKASTIAAYRSKLGRFFAWLKVRGMIATDPFDGIPYPRVEYEDRKYLGKREVERIFSALVLGAPWRSHALRVRNIAIFTTLLYTGLRKGELLGLRLSDVNLDHLELVVRAETSKSRLRRVVPVNSALARAIEGYLEVRRRQPLMSDALFADVRGTHPLTAEGLKHLIEQVRRVSGVPFHAHQFRHTFAVNFLNRGGDVAKLKQLLGHRDIRMTSTYLRCLPTSAMRNDVECITLDTLL